MITIRERHGLYYVDLYRHGLYYVDLYRPDKHIIASIYTSTGEEMNTSISYGSEDSAAHHTKNKAQESTRKSTTVATNHKKTKHSRSPVTPSQKYHAALGVFLALFLPQFRSR